MQDKTVDPKDRLRLDRAVIDMITKEYGETFRHAYELVHRVTGKIHLIPSNELRNALDHITKVLTEQKSLNDAERELINARAHMMLAVVDCFLLMYIARREVLEDASDAVQNDVISPVQGWGDESKEQLLTSWDDIKDMRNRIHGIGPQPMPTQPDGKIRANLEAIERTYETFAVLVTRCNQLYEKMLDLFSVEQIIRAHAHGLAERDKSTRRHPDEYWFQAEESVRRSGRAILPPSGDD